LEVGGEDVLASNPGRLWRRQRRVNLKARTGRSSNLTRTDDVRPPQSDDPMNPTNSISRSIRRHYTRRRALICCSERPCILRSFILEFRPEIMSILLLDTLSFSARKAIRAWLAAPSTGGADTFTVTRSSLIKTWFFDDLGRTFTLICAWRLALSISLLRHADGYLK